MCSSDLLIGLLFPLLSYPYLSRVLGPERLGAVHFIDYSIGLIYGIASLGIPAYGMYRIAQLQALGLNKRQAYLQMTVLHVSLSAIGFLFFYWALQGQTHLVFIQTLLPLAGIHLIANSASAEWYLQGRERFDIPAVRNLVLRTIGLIAIFGLVLQIGRAHV